MQHRSTPEAPAIRSFAPEPPCGEAAHASRAAARLDLAGTGVTVFSLVADLDHIECDALVASSRAWLRPTRFVPPSLALAGGVAL
jgi:hypothetical protein